MQLGGDNLLTLINQAPRFDMDCEDGVRAGRALIQCIVSHGSLLFSLKKLVQRFLLVFDLNGGEACDDCFPVWVVPNCNTGSSLLIGRLVTEHVEHQLVVNFDVAHLHSDLVVVTPAHFRENGVDGSRDKTTIFEIGGRAAHSECLARAGLPVTHDGSIIAVDDLFDCLLRAVVKHVLLAGIVQQLVKFKFPLLRLVVDDAPRFVLGHTNRHSLFLKKQAILAVK